MTNEVGPPRRIPVEIVQATGRIQLDEVDRQELDPRIKLQLLCTEARQEYGADPRGGGFCFVGRPAYVLQLLIDIGAGPLSSELRLNKSMIVGAADILTDPSGADVVGWWRDIPVVVRSSTVKDGLVCCRLDQLRPSHQVDRRQSGVMRRHGHNSTLDRVRELED